ncbi:MAG: type II toxin-antitoxin system RelB/DinJ family antitoxin [Candidatus Paceibacterota bacterium]
MNNAVINFNTDPKIKKEFIKTLDDMGLTLSIALNHAVRKIIAEKRIEFTTPEIPNARLKRSTRNAHKEYASGKMVVYKTFEDLEKHLLSL